MKSHTPVKAIDFFCGAGGLTRGLLDAGMEVVAGVDSDKRLKKTYEANNVPSEFVAEDIFDSDVRSLRRRFGIKKSDVVLYAACTPCQPFSTLNQRRGGWKEDSRRSLLLRFGEIVRESPPDFILVENVPGLGNAYGREIYARFLELITDAGFVHPPAGGRLDASQYGVPQVRKRFILIAARKREMALPSPDGIASRTVRDAIGHLPEAEEGREVLANHVYRTPKPHHVSILQAVPPDGGSRSDVADESVLLECHKKAPTVHRDVFGRMKWDAPAPTLTCRCTDVYCGRFAHPERDRGLTLREAAALQTFGDDYVFYGSFFHIAAQIGNAVPVAFARRLGEEVVAVAGGIS